MKDLHAQMQQRACIDGLRNYQKYLEKTIHQMLDSIKLLPEGDVKNKLLHELSAVDVTADAMLWAVQIMDPE